MQGEFNMKKDIIKLCILTVSLIIISFTFILLMGKTLTFSFKISNNNKLILDDNDTVEVIDERKENNKYIVTIKAKKPGKGYLHMNYGDEGMAEGRILYVHKTGVITDNNIFGYSRGSEIIPISLSVILIYILWILIKKYKKSVKDNLYQYGSQKVTVVDENNTIKIQYEEGSILLDNFIEINAQAEQEKLMEIKQE